MTRRAYLRTTTNHANQSYSKRKRKQRRRTTTKYVWQLVTLVFLQILLSANGVPEQEAARQANNKRTTMVRLQGARALSRIVYAGFRAGLGQREWLAARNDLVKRLSSRVRSRVRSRVML